MFFPRSRIGVWSGLSSGKGTSWGDAGGIWLGGGVGLWGSPVSQLRSRHGLTHSLFGRQTTTLAPAFQIRGVWRQVQSNVFCEKG